MKLHVRAIFLQDKKMQEACFDLPYENGEHRFPKEAPFDRAFYLGPDYGYSLDVIKIDVEKRSLNLGYDETVVLDEGGHAHWRGRGVELDFDLNE